MGKTTKIILVLIITLLLVGIFNEVLAIEPDYYEPDPATTQEAEEVITKVGKVLGAIRNISVIVSVVALMIIGFKYIMGSAEQKANYKSTLLPYIIGAVIAVSGTTVVSFIYNAVH